MGNFRQKMQNFMLGRNGADELGAVVLSAGMVCYFMYFFTKDGIWNSASTVCFVYALFRMLSKNVCARREENKKVVLRLQLLKLRWQVRKTHKVYLCSCGRLVRVPKGKGKLEVTCPVCGKKKMVNS